MQRACRICQDWRGCVGYAYYSWGDIRFCRYQIIWLIENLDSLRDGIYPRSDTETGYTEIGSKRISPRAAFERPAQLASEIEWRLERTGTEGKLLVVEIKSGVDVNEMNFESRRALNYISGWRRRRISYPKWKANQKYKSKGRINGDTSNYPSTARV